MRLEFNGLASAACSASRRRVLRRLIGAIRIVTLANSVLFRTYNEGFGEKTLRNWRLRRCPADEGPRHESRSRIAEYVVAIAFMVVGYPVCGDCSQYLAVAEDAHVTPQVAC